MEELKLSSRIEYNEECLNVCFIDGDIEFFTIRLKQSNTSYIISIIYEPYSKHDTVNEFTTIVNQLL